MAKRIIYKNQHSMYRTRKRARLEQAEKEEELVQQQGEIEHNLEQDLVPQLGQNLEQNMESNLVPHIEQNLEHDLEQNFEQNSDNSKPARPKCFNDLNDDCANYIFSQFSLQHQFYYREVCHHWKSTIEKYCYDKGRMTLRLFTHKSPITHRFMSRTHLFYAEDVNEYIREQDNPEETLYFPDNYIARLLDIFPTLHQLVIHFHCDQTEQNIDHLFEFLRQVGPRLTLFSFWMPNELIHVETLVPRLCDLINETFTSVSELNLYTDNCFVRNPEYYQRKALNELEAGEVYSLGQYRSHDHLELSRVLPQLEKFALNCHSSNHREMMRHLGASLKMLSIDCQYLDTEQFKRCVSRGHPEWAKTITRLRIRSMKCPESMLSLMRNNFHQLECLELSYANNYPIAQFDEKLIEHLLPLKHLTELKLTDFGISTKRIPPGTRPVVCLPQIRKLTLCARAMFKDVNILVFCYNLPLYFPDIEELTIVSFNREPEPLRAELRRWLMSGLFKNLIKFNCHLDI